jgi:hypothetical protein
MPRHAKSRSTKPTQRLSRSLGNPSHVNSSVAAERALDAGDEMEDALWLGSGRLDGSMVRRQLRSSRRISGIGIGSQRFLQSMRFWGSNYNSNNNNSKAMTSLSLSIALTREQQLMASIQLLSMRCEASQSIRRRRGTPTASRTIMQWIPDPTDLKPKGLPRLHLWNTAITCSASCEQAPRLSSPKADPNPSGRKKWRPWLPNTKKTIQPTYSEDSYASASSSSQVQLQSRTPDPAKVLRQQLRQSLPRGTRNLFPSETHSNSNANTKTNILTTLADADLSSSHDDSTRSVRSTRNDVRSNQSLLVRRPPTRGLDHTKDDEKTQPLVVQPSKKRRNRVSILLQPKDSSGLLSQNLWKSQHDPVTARALSSSDHATTNNMDQDQDDNSYCSSFKNNDNDNHDDKDDSDYNHFYTVQDLLDFGRGHNIVQVETTGATTSSSPHESQLQGPRCEQTTRNDDWKQDPCSVTTPTSHATPRTRQAHPPSLYMQKQTGLIRLECLEEIEEETESLNSSSSSSSHHQHRRHKLRSSFSTFKEESLLEIPILKNSKVATSNQSSLQDAGPFPLAMRSMSRGEANPNRGIHSARATRNRSPSSRDVPEQQQQQQQGQNTRVSPWTPVYGLLKQGNNRHIRGTRDFDESIEWSEADRDDNDNDDDDLGDSQASLDRPSSLGLDPAQEPWPSGESNTRNCSNLSSLDNNQDGGEGGTTLGWNGASLSSRDFTQNNKRNSLPAFALGSRQHGIRGGIIAEYAMEAILEASLQLQEQEETKGRPKPKGFLRQTRTALESWWNHTQGGHRLKRKNGGTLATVPNQRCDDGGQDSPAAQDIDKGFQVVWNQDSDNGAADPPTAAGERSTATGHTTKTTIDDWWNFEGEETDALQDTHSFCSNAFIIWDQDVEQEPVIVRRKDPPAPLLSSPSRRLGCLDAWSVASEPAQIGMFEDSFHNEDDMENLVSNQWLMAWDDLALVSAVQDENFVDF